LEKEGKGEGWMREMEEEGKKVEERKRVKE